MLFYVALIVAGVVAAAIIVWLYRSITMAGKTAYRSMSPGRGQPKLTQLNSNLATTPTPWGWGSGGGTSAAGRYDRHRTFGESVSRSKSRDFSGLEAYARSNEKMALERDATSPHVGSVRNVLTGYDMQRVTRLDTSSWPYQDSYASGSSAVPDDSPSLTEKRDRPSKPWGW
jgi:hypothetical protein